MFFKKGYYKQINQKESSAAQISNIEVKTIDVDFSVANLLSSYGFSGSQYHIYPKVIKKDPPSVRKPKKQQKKYEQQSMSTKQKSNNQSEHKTDNKKKASLKKDSELKSQKRNGSIKIMCLPVQKNYQICENPSTKRTVFSNGKIIGEINVKSSQRYNTTGIGTKIIKTINGKKFQRCRSPGIIKPDGKPNGKPDGKSTRNIQKNEYFEGFKISPFVYKKSVHKDTKQTQTKGQMVSDLRKRQKQKTKQKQIRKSRSQSSGGCSLRFKPDQNATTRNYRPNAQKRTNVIKDYFGEQKIQLKPQKQKLDPKESKNQRSLSKSGLRTSRQRTFSTSRQKNMFQSSK